MKRVLQQCRLGSWRMALLAIVAVGCSQLALAGHQFEHDFASISEVCGVCASMQNFSAPPPSLADLPERPVARDAAPKFSCIVVPADRGNVCPVRGPPRQR